MVIEGILNCLRIREGDAALIDNGAAETMDPWGGIVGGAVLLYKTVAAPAGVVLHVAQQFPGCSRNFIVLHIAAVVHEQQRFKVQRKLVQSAFVSGRFQGHGQIIV